MIYFAFAVLLFFLVQDVVKQRKHLDRDGILHDGNVCYPILKVEKQANKTKKLF